MNRTLSQLPDATRLWIFGSSRPLAPDEASAIERNLSEYVAGWTAHGAPLDATVTVLEDRFVVIAVDERAARASGCSIDDMVRRISALERDHDVSLLDGTLVFYRNAAGEVESCDRATFRARARRGDVTATTIAIDPTVGSLGDLRAGAFERPVSESWHRRLLSTEPQGTG